jgi:ADP-ribosylglycohydrolase
MDADRYLEKVYAGVLGKIIGVYMGRPFEGWTHDQIISRFGEVVRFENQTVGAPLVLTDDDIGGTFVFIRALEDYGFDPTIEASAIGQTWLNYLVYKRTILWWGGYGNSTEHTAYLRLRSGIKAPASGALELNGPTAANQIGAQIFIDGWALVSPNDPVQAVSLAKKAASVSHDGEAVFAAMVIAALESLAFEETDFGRMFDRALSFIPKDCLVAKLTSEIREFHGRENDWREARAWLDREYGYDRYRGVCHVIPNYGLIVMSLLYGGGDFRRSLMIVNTSGHDTDCNAGNVGCILGIRNGLAAIEACPDLRWPHRDLLYLSSADGGRCVSDAGREALYLANVHNRISGKPMILPKDGARYNFELPGAVHAFDLVSENGLGRAEICNTPLPDRQGRGLEMKFDSAETILVGTPVFSLESRITQYETQASPSLYPGQVIQCAVMAGKELHCPVVVRPFVAAFGAGDISSRYFGPETTLGAEDKAELEWKVDIDPRLIIWQVGLQLASSQAQRGRIWLSRMDWGGTPSAIFRRMRKDDRWWKDAWVNGVDEWGVQFPESYRLSQNEGTGLIIQGAREWRDYAAHAIITPFLAEGAGIAVRVQGMKRYYALLLCRDGTVALVKELDGTTVLSRRWFGIKENNPYECRISVIRNRISASVNGAKLFDVEDENRTLTCGAVGLVLTQGTLSCDEVLVGPADER